MKSLPRSTCKLDVLDNELSILRKLDHPNLVRLHEIYRDEKYFHFVTEFLSGGELYSHIQRRGPLTETEASMICLQLI